MRAVGLVARREIIARLQQRGFVIGVLIVVVIVGAVAALPAFLGGSSADRYDIGVVSAPDRPSPDAPAPDRVMAALRALDRAGDGGTRVVVHALDDAADARGQVRDGDLDAALDGSTLLVRGADSTAASILRSAVAAAALQQALADAGLGADQIGQVLAAPAIAVDEVGSSDSDIRRALATVINIALFGQLVTFISWVAIGVVEEKSSRVVEIVLSAIRPSQLLAGKLLGIGALALGQLAACAIVGLSVVTLTGSVDLPPQTYPAVAICLVWFLFGFAFYAAAAAAAASLVSRQEEVSGVLSPITVVVMVSYFLGFATANSSGPFAQVVSVIPPLSALTMPARVAGGDVPWWQVALSLALLALASAAVVGIAGRIYRAAVLHAGSRFPLRQALRSSTRSASGAAR